MSYKVITLSYFDKQAKRLVKKYPSLKQELISLIESLQNNPTQGVGIGNNCFKIRIAIASKGKGKRGGARIISHVHIDKEKVYLLSMYDKAEQENISDLQIKALLNLIH
ncbi:hypothetical protein A9P82_12350 [Arachidicoccus ginsenosidimutans]|uniref:type II toxin-antitoxin system RelE/ParE family toxin n=1 Tax=Arachidicoccus sp. BS20 TaxID=1850526 RepID=UPI0007F0BD56|nr:type II toxin-antitoxin system RelE/ParE family toxin [Arachidicoccus sp. BS20]ANI90003.1 hypothetical protein A9P82_12350 [Arachidicoccus sp. BS20]